MKTHRKFATVIVVACLLHLPYVAFCKHKGDANKKEERVEIKYLVPEANIETVAKRLKLDPDHPTETRVICFYDTDALTLFTRTPKVILRSRYRAGTDQKTGDTTVKVRGGKVEGKGVKCEFDKVIGKDKMESCSLTDENQELDQIQTANKGSGVKRIFNHDQEELLKQANINLDWNLLVPFGPVEGVKIWKDLSAEGLDKVTVERWELPARDGKPKRVLFEVSTKVPVSQESQATEALSKALGITSAEKQEEETKTKIVMDHYAGDHSTKP